MRSITHYPLIALADSTSDRETGIIEGTDGSTETSKKIWTAAEERQIEDTITNRELAYDIDPLVRHISNIKRFSILEYYELSSTDDTKYDKLITEIGIFLEEINLLQRFRESFTPLQIQGATHIQTWPETGKKLEGLSVLKNVQKFVNPTNNTDYYFYQCLQVSKNWQDPCEEGTEEKKAWFIDLDKEGEFTTINKGADLVISRDNIIEILSNEVGESNLQPILSHIFIKNYLMQLLPNLITIVTSPDEQLIYDTRDVAGNLIIPEKPPLSLQTTDSDLYVEQNDIYNTWKDSLQTLADKITDDRTKLGKTIHPDTIKEEILQSDQSLNSDMITALVLILDTQIAYGMGFSLSLLDAKGVELTTSRNIFATVSVTMRGIQEQYERIAQKIINERFPEAERIGIKFKLGELTPEDEQVGAATKKLYAETIEILSNLGLGVAEANNFMGRHIDESLAISAKEVSPEAAEAAAGAVEAMLDYTALMKTSDSEEEIEE